MNRIFTVLIIFCLSVSSWAQTASPTPEATSPTPSPTAVVTASPTPQVTETPTPEAAATPTPAETPKSNSDENQSVPVEFSTPRRSLENFMATMALAGPLRPDLYLEANKHLNLSRISRVVRDEQGVTLSKQLYSILDTSVLKLDNLDVEPGARTVTIYQQPSGDKVELMKQENGEWLFSANTVEAIPRMYKVLSKKGRIESYQIEALDFDFLGMNGNLWLALLLLPVLSYGMGSLVLMLLRIPLSPILARKLSLENEEQKRLLKPLGWLAASLFAWLGLTLLDLPPLLLIALTVVVKVIATGAVMTGVFRASDAVSIYVASFTANTSTKFDDMLIPLVRRSIKTLVAIVGVLFLAQNLDIEVWSLFAGFSIFGAMVALAGQDLVKNFFGSVTVLTDQPFAVGDWIVVNGIEGVVEEVGFRSTRIRTFYDSLVTLPNSALITASVDNYGSRNYRRYSKKIPIRWNTPPEKVEAFCEGLREIVRRHHYTRKDSYQVWVNDVNDYALQILVYIFFAAPDWNTELRERHRFLVDLHRLACDMDIEFAYPSQRLILARHEDHFEESFDLEKQQTALKEGKEKATQLLDRSLPKETPPPAVVE